MEQCREGFPELELCETKERGKRGNNACLDFTYSKMNEESTSIHHRPTKRWTIKKASHIISHHRGSEVNSVM